MGVSLPAAVHVDQPAGVVAGHMDRPAGLAAVQVVGCRGLLAAPEN